ncbi:MAG: DNA mismatch repair protein MutL, partial [Alphaproteobacteria bacterium]
MTIRRLPPTLIDQIAAGEVVERPASAVKELVENALDAGAGQIDVVLEDGGKRLLAVTDDGCGMDPDDMALALERHATSKLDGDDLVNIRALGFRGEALPSIASVSRLTLTSRTAGMEAAWRIRVEGGRTVSAGPAAAPAGTCAVVEDLFYATPARLKFLKTERTEQAAIVDVVKRLAMAHPSIAFTVATPERRLLDVAAGQGVRDRLAAILGREFGDNAMDLDWTRGELALTGLAAVPTFNRGTGQFQYLFVNG